MSLTSGILSSTVVRAAAVVKLVLLDILPSISFISALKEPLVASWLFYPQYI